MVDLKLFLGDALADVDLGGLAKLGFRVQDIIDSEKNSSDPDAPLSSRGSDSATQANDKPALPDKH